MPHLTMSDGTQIFYEDQGTGETVLIFHGFQSSHLKIGSFIGEFKGSCRCVCYDQRGHGAFVFRDRIC